MNFQHAAGSLWRINSRNRLFLGHGLAAICLLNLPVIIGPQNRLSATDVLPVTVGVPLADPVSIETLPVQAMAWELDLPGNTTIGNFNDSNDDSNNAGEDSAGLINQSHSDPAMEPLSPLPDDNRAVLTNDPRRDQQWSFLDLSLIHISEPTRPY